MFHKIKEEQVSTPIPIPEELHETVLTYDRDGYATDKEPIFAKRIIFSDGVKYVRSAYYVLCDSSGLVDLEGFNKYKMRNTSLKPVSPECYHFYMKYLNLKQRSHFNTAKVKNEKV